MGKSNYHETNNNTTFQNMFLIHYILNPCSYLIEIYFYKSLFVKLQSNLLYESQF